MWSILIVGSGSGMIKNKNKMVEEKKSESVGLKELLRNYIKVYSPLDYYLECIDNKVNPRTIHLAKRSFLHREIPNFIKFYSEININDYLHDPNYEKIKMLDKCTEELNHLRESGEIHDGSLRSIYTTIKNIYGDK